MSTLTYDRILLFGDSLTQQGFDPDLRGWGAFLANQYMRKVEVCNRGFSGYTTKWCRALLPAVFRDFKTSSTHTRLMTIWLGANDAVDATANPQQAVTLESYKQNLTAMIETAKSFAPDVRVLVLTPPPVDEEKWGEHCKQSDRKPDRTLERTGLYRDACVEVAKEARSKWPDDIRYVDTFKALGIAEGMPKDEINAILRNTMTDGLHFNSKGNAIVGQFVLDAIKQSWPDLAPENLKPVTPWHRDITDDIVFYNQFPE